MAALKPCGADGPSLTASFGVAALGPEDVDGGRLMGRADAAMYEAKRAGGDRVALARAGGD